MNRTDFFVIAMFAAYACAFAAVFNHGRARAFFLWSLHIIAVTAGSYAAWVAGEYHHDGPAIYIAIMATVQTVTTLLLLGPRRLVAAYNRWRNGPPAGHARRGRCQAGERHRLVGVDLEKPARDRRVLPRE